MATETEMKLEVGDLQLLDCILTSPEVRQKMQTEYSYLQMQATYFDTPDAALAKKRQMLRLRKENERSVLTFKTPADGYCRGEWETEAEVLRDGIAALCENGAPEALKALQGRELLPICGASYTRIVCTLCLSDGTKFSLCGDLGEVFAQARRAPICEIELELQDGSEAAMLAFGKELMQRYGLTEGAVSKFARANALREKERRQI